MEEPLLQIGSLLLGEPTAANFGYLTLTMDGSGPDFPHAQVLEWDGNSLGDIEMVPWRAIGLGVIRPATGTELIAVGETGQCLRFSSGVRSEEMIPVELDQDKARGPLRGARAIGNEVYAVGMDCQVFRRSSSGMWQSIDARLRGLPALQGAPGFEAVFGSGTSCLYAVGWRGVIARFDGQDWTVLDSPTNTILTDGTALAGTDDVVVCGRVGTVIIGNARTWTVVDHPYRYVDFWGVAQVEGRIVLSSYNGLFELDLGRAEVRPIELSLDPAPTSFGRLASRDDVLWSIGAKDLLELHGNTWRKLL